MPRHSIKGPFFMIKNLVLASLAIVFGAGETRAPVPAKSRNLNQRVQCTSRIDVNLKTGSIVSTLVPIIFRSQ